MKQRLTRHVFWAIPATAILLIAVQKPLAAQEKPTRPTAEAYRPVAPKIDLMEWHDRAFNSMRLAIAKSKPEAAEHAWLLAELANVNTRHSEEADYRKWAGEVRDASVAIAKAAKEKKFDKAKALAKTMSESCAACHDKYQ